MVLYGGPPLYERKARLRVVILCLTAAEFLLVAYLAYEFWTLGLGALDDELFKETALALVFGGCLLIAFRARLASAETAATKTAAALPSTSPTPKIEPEPEPPLQPPRSPPCFPQRRSQSSSLAAVAHLAGAGLTPPRLSPTALEGS